MRSFVFGIQSSFLSGNGVFWEYTVLWYYMGGRAGLSAYPFLSDAATITGIVASPSQLAKEYRVKS